MSDGDLQKRLEKLGRTLVEDIEAWEQATRDKRRHAMERLTETVSRKIERSLDRQKARDLKRQAKAELRAERRRQQREEASVVGGVVYLLLAAVCLAYAVLRPEFFWLLFVALGMGLSGARQFRDVAARKQLAAREEPPALPAPAAAPAKPHEVDVLCDQLLADLKGSPEAVRSFLNDPEKTVETMRKTARSLDARRQQLLADADAERRAAVEQQRAELVRKRDGLQSAEAKQRLDGAIGSLDAQLAALGQLRSAAERIDGEYTSLLVLLQELRTRVAVAKTAGTTPQFEGLQQNVQRLNDELEAITGALAEVQRDGLPAVVAISSDEAAAPVPERERV